MKIRLAVSILVLAFSSLSHGANTPSDVQAQVAEPSPFFADILFEVVPNTYTQKEELDLAKETFLKIDGGKKIALVQYLKLVQAAKASQSPLPARYAKIKSEDIAFYDALMAIASKDRQLENSLTNVALLWRDHPILCSMSTQDYLSELRRIRKIKAQEEPATIKPVLQPNGVYIHDEENGHERVM